jgi:hypothetical protein
MEVQTNLRIYTKPYKSLSPITKTTHSIGVYMLAFGLSHSYPQTTNAFWKGLEARLKGPDAVLLQAVQRSQLAYLFKAAFQLRQNSGSTDAEQFENAECRNLSDAVLHAVYRNGLDRYEVS